jgi:hypothetical protein
MKKILFLFLFLIMISVIFFYLKNNTSHKINRKNLVYRHNPSVRAPDKLSPFTVGNGEFAFTADFTGLQTFPDYYDEKSIPLGTQSHWGWHSFPNPENFTLEQSLKDYDTYGRPVGYASETNNAAARWLRANPHRLHLGQIGFKINRYDGKEIRISDVENMNQTLNLWEGIIYSNFSIDNKPVTVKTSCHPKKDQIAVQVSSQLIKDDRLTINFRFPYGSGSWGKASADWQSIDKHISTILNKTEHSVLIKRILDKETYFVKFDWEGEGVFKENAPHDFELSPSGNNQFGFTCFFSSQPISTQPETVSEILNNSRSHWKMFWERGGAIDLSGSKDPRATELERRIVLSQYLTAVQCAGSLPPQETGLTCNSWYGKFHLEMHWWHAVQFILWGRPELFERSLSWYTSHLQVAQQKARRQGYAGARWPKMIGPDGEESPSGVGVFLIWQQPHPIYYSELLYRIKKERSYLEKFQDVVFQTAEFMASYAAWDNKNNRYVLGPPLIPAQEIYRATETKNPAFELSYWTFGLETAQKWRERLELPRKESWDNVLQSLSSLPENNGYYQNTETALNTFEDSFNRNDHPTLLGAFGMLPNKTINIEKMRGTLKKVMETWNWNRTWGWDYPLTAMTAARVGEPDIAIEALLMDVQKNSYLNNGHNYQDERLTLYLPGNGGLLAAIAMMAAGWDGAPDSHAPGFPQNDNWKVRWEGLHPLP